MKYILALMLPVMMIGQQVKPPVKPVSRPYMLFHSHKLYGCRLRHFTRGCVPLSPSEIVGTPYIPTPSNTLDLSGAGNLTLAPELTMPEPEANWSSQSDENGQHVYKLTTKPDWTCTLMVNDSNRPTMFSVTCIKSGGQ